MGSDSDQLGNLMTYTVFHIGAYITLGTAVMAGGAITHIDHPVLRFSLVCMLVSGSCGGVIASCIPDHKTWDGFASGRIGPWRRQWLTYAQWATVEHGVFWVGILVPVAVYLLCGAAPFTKAG